MGDVVEVHRSDLEKVYDTLDKAESFLRHRDHMNADVHLATTVRYSPLTSNVMAERQRVEGMLK